MWRLPLLGAVCAGALALSGAAPVPPQGASPALVGEVQPGHARPGERVTLTLRGCDDPQEGGRAEGALIGDGTTARTPIEVTDLRAGTDGVLHGRTEISPQAHPGTAQVAFACSSDPEHVATAPVVVLAPATPEQAAPRGAIAAGSEQGPPEHDLGKPAGVALLLLSGATTALFFVHRRRKRGVLNAGKADPR